MLYYWVKNSLVIFAGFERVKNSFRRNSMIYRECYGFEISFFTLRRFLPYTSSCWFQGFPGSWQFNLRVSRALCWSSKHSPGPIICLNHKNPQKRYGGRFYLRVTDGWLMKNLPLTGFKLFSQLVSMSEASCFIRSATEPCRLSSIKALAFSIICVLKALSWQIDQHS